MCISEPESRNESDKRSRKRGQENSLVADPGFAKTPSSENPQALEKEGVTFVLFNGVEPRGRGRDRDQGAREIAPERKCDFVLGDWRGEVDGHGQSGGDPGDVTEDRQRIPGAGSSPEPGLRKAWFRPLPVREAVTARLYQRTGKKESGINSPYLYPDLSFLDPELTVGLLPQSQPIRVWMALAHGWNYLSKAASPVSEMISLEAIRRIGRSLRRAVQEGGDLAARSDSSGEFSGRHRPGQRRGNGGSFSFLSSRRDLSGPSRRGHGLLLRRVMEYNSFLPCKVGPGADAMARRSNEFGGARAVRAVQSVKKWGRIGSLGV